VLASVFARYGDFTPPAAFNDGLVPATWIGAGVVAAGAVIALAIPPIRRRRQERLEPALEPAG
jgi:hypothetical protein